MFEAKRHRIYCVIHPDTIGQMLRLLSSGRTLRMAACNERENGTKASDALELVLLHQPSRLSYVKSRKNRCKFNGMQFGEWVPLVRLLSRASQLPPITLQRRRSTPRITLIDGNPAVLGIYAPLLATCTTVLLICPRLAVPGVRQSGGAT